MTEPEPESRRHLLLLLSLSQKSEILIDPAGSSWQTTLLSPPSCEHPVAEVRIGNRSHISHFAVANISQSNIRRPCALKRNI